MSLSETEIMNMDYWLFRKRVKQFETYQKNKKKAFDDAESNAKR